MAGNAFTPTGFAAKTAADNALDAANDALAARRTDVQRAQANLERRQAEQQALEQAVAGGDQALAAARDQANQAATAAQAELDATEVVPGQEQVEEANRKTQNVLRGRDRRAKAQEKRAHDRAKDDFQGLLDADAEGRQQAIAEAQGRTQQTAADLAQAQQALQAAQADQAQKAQTAAQYSDLGPEWTTDQTPRNIRRKERALRDMHADIEDLTKNVPADARQYCQEFERTLDQAAHHVDCERCPAGHGIDRTAEAKAQVIRMVDDLLTMPNLPPPDDPTEYSELMRSTGARLQELHQSGGKMIGVLKAQHPDGRIETIYGFSGDMPKPDGPADDDVPGWAPHIPPEGGVMQTANGVAVPLDALPDVGDGTPHGVCAAPKMIQEAYRRGLTPVAIAEAWFGVGPPQTQPHGALVASCSTCMANLPIQLCDNYPQPQGNGGDESS